MVLTNRWNRIRYRLYAPIYDAVARPLERGRQRAIDRLDPQPGDRVLIVGCGTGMDLGYHPDDVEITAIDLTATMVRRTAARASTLDQDVPVAIADAQTLPFDDGTFDAVLLHLVLSVVPDPTVVVKEAERVLTPDGWVSIYVTFSPEESDLSLARRLAHPVARLLFADCNRSLDPMITGIPFVVGDREPFLGGLYTVTIARSTAEE